MRTLVRFVSEGATTPACVCATDFSGKVGQQIAVMEKGDRTILCGLGKRPTSKDLRKAIHSAMTLLKKTNTKSAHVVIPKSLRSLTTSTTNFFGPKSTSLDHEQVRRQAITWCYTSLYEDERHKSKRTAAPIALSFGHAPRGTLDHDLVLPGKIVADAINSARDLGNARPDECTPLAFAREAQHLSHVTRGCKHKLTVRHVLAGSELKRAGLHLLHAVGKGSPRPPQLVVLEYIGDPSSDSSTAFVGKGITMDTGGLNVKPFGSMETMHMDMMGAAAVFGLTKAVAQLQLPVNIVSVFALAENAIGSHATLPSQIVKSLQGTTVEITNTDAEGRLVLADAMTFVQNHAKLKTRVDFMIDVATLTGAITVALGNERAGLFSNNYGMVDTLVASGEEVLEPVWPMPITPEHEKKMKGTMSDLINCTSDRYAGACTAAAFLKHFVTDTVQWAHLDIAGPGMGTKATEVHPAGAPGYGVQLLLRYLEKRAKQ